MSKRLDECQIGPNANSYNSSVFEGDRLIGGGCKCNPQSSTSAGENLWYNIRGMFMHTVYILYAV